MIVCFFIIFNNGFVLCMNVDLLMVACIVKVEDNLIRLVAGGDAFIHFFLKIIIDVSIFDLINNGE